MGVERTEGDNGGENEQKPPYTCVNLSELFKSQKETVL